MWRLREPKFDMEASDNEKKKQFSLKVAEESLLNRSTRRPVSLQTTTLSDSLHGQKQQTK
jgi:hypothetical protein